MEGELARRADDLARSNAELEQFAYVASHDLQEPLRSITGYLQLLTRRYRDQLDQSAQNFVDRSVAGVQRMQNLIGDLLLYSRVGTHGKPFERVDCTTILDQVRDSLNAAIEESGATVAHQALPAVQADPTQLLQLFQNLIGNAVKFRGEQPPQIHVGAERQDDEWLFSVRDNGIGIDAEQAERIFHIFQRLHTRDEYEGTGIGLAVCKKIVERHGGRIWMESQPGEGTTFYFTIPQISA